MSDLKILGIASKDVPNFSTSDERLRYGSWRMALVGGTHRDCTALDESNANVIRAGLKQLDPDNEHWDILSANHWAVGWYDHVIFDPSHEPIVIFLTEILRRLDGYPVLDEEEWSRLEMERHDDGRCDGECGFCEQDRDTLPIRGMGCGH